MSNLSDSLAQFGRSMIPPWLNTLSTGALEAGTENVRNTAGTSLSYVAVSMEWTLSGFISCLSHYFRQFVLFIVKFSSGLEKDLQKKTSKSESKSKSTTLKSKSKSKSGINGLESGLESKSGLEYYKSGCSCVGRI